MKKVILIISVMLVRQMCFAQSSNPDSLVNILNHLKKDDTAKLSLMNQIALGYTGSDLNKGSQMADRAVALGKQLNYKPGLADAFLFKGMNQNFGGDHKESLISFQKALDIYEPLHDKKGIAKSLNNMGFAYYSMSDPNKALDFNLRALKVADSLGDPVVLGSVNNNLGNDYKTLSDFSRSIEHYQKALNAYMLANNLNGVGAANGNIGNIYITIKEPGKGIDYLQNAYDVFKKINNTRGMSLALHNIGVAYKTIAHKTADEKDVQNYKKGLEYFKQALEKDKEIGNKRGMADNFDVIGQTYNELKVYDSAITNLQQSLAMYEAENNKTGIATELTYLSNSILLAPSNVLKEKGINPAKRYIDALAYQHKAISLSKVTDGGLEEQSVEWENLSLIYEKQKRYDSALFAYKKFKDAADSSFNMEKSDELTRKTMQYDFDKKEALLKSSEDKKQALATAEISRQKVVRNAAIGGTSTVLLASLFTFVFYKRRNDAKFQAKVSDTEMKALRAQMNPHFIFNSLNSIGDYISNNNLQAADKYLTKFAKLMRSVLENSEQKEIPLADDLKALELYMQLESLRMNNKFTYEIKVDDDINKENTLIPPLILQPFVENSIWHGIAKKQGSGKIFIHIKKAGNMLNCIIEDDGIGIQKSSVQNEERKSFGMKVTNSRIDILNKTKKTSGSVNLWSLDQGTRAEVKLPLQLSF